MTRTGRFNPEIAGPETSGAKCATIRERRVDAKTLGRACCRWNTVFTEPGH